MKLRKPLVLAATASAVLMAVALPASAAPGDPVDTTTTFTLTGGALTFTAAAGAALTDGASGATSITGTLGTVSVSDLRGGVEEWSVSVVSTAFTGSEGSSSTDVDYTAGTVTETGTIVVADGTITDVASATAVVSPTSSSGNNTASWNPTLAVTMPSNALADDYTGTVTTSIL
jgi:hypothetical protein